jgi:hypothetical protein
LWQEVVFSHSKIENCEEGDFGISVAYSKVINSF